MSQHIWTRCEIYIFQFLCLSASLFVSHISPVQNCKIHVFYKNLVTCAVFARRTFFNAAAVVYLELWVKQIWPLLHRRNTELVLAHICSPPSPHPPPASFILSPHHLLRVKSITAREATLKISSRIQSACEMHSPLAMWWWESLFGRKISAYANRAGKFESLILAGSTQKNMCRLAH